MGEEAKQEQPKDEPKPEENPAEEKPEKVPVEEKKEHKPPSPTVLFVDLHCIGCAKKIKKSIMKMEGVEGVEIDMAKNEVTIKGTVEPQAICNIITKKTKKRAQVISPLPEAGEGEPTPETVTSQGSESVTLELNINMHCEACSQQLKKKILKMRGVETAVTELNTGKVIVTGTIDAKKLVDYVYRRTKKQVKIVTQPKPQPPENKELVEKVASAEEVKPEEENKQEEKALEEGGGNDENENKEEEEAKKLQVGGDELNIDDESMKRTTYHYYYYQPLYVIDTIPPPQLFSDENPNACCIS